MPLHLRHFDDAGAFLAHAEPWLLRAEAEHNLLLGLARRLQASTEGFQPPIYLATVESENGMAGCVFRTPPFALGLTHLPGEGVPLVVADVATYYEDLPAVLGPPAVVRAVAERWCRLRGVMPGVEKMQRIYQLTQVTGPEPMPAGTLRVAGSADRTLVRQWIAAFCSEAGLRGPDRGPLVEGLLARGGVYLFDAGGPVSMAMASARTPHGVRIGYVYTPPAQRGRGYASACVARLSQQFLDEGLRLCFLYTDLANPTSNRIYQRIGYRPVCDVCEAVFLTPAGPAARPAPTPR